MATKYMSTRFKRIRKFYHIATRTLKKLRLDWGFTYSFPFLQQWSNYENPEDMISEYDNALRTLYIEPHYKALQDAFPSLSIPTDIVHDIYEFEYGERAYRVFKHYLVQRLKSQHPSTIYVIPFTLGCIEVLCAAFTSITIVHDMLSEPASSFSLTFATFILYTLTSLCHLVGILLSYFYGKQLSKKLKIMNEQLLLYIYGGDTKHNLNRRNLANKPQNGLINIYEEQPDEEDEEDEEDAEVVWNFKRNYSNHSNYSNTSNTSNTSTQSTFSALHKAFGCSEDANFFANYTSLFVEDYMSKMRSRVTNGYDIAAFDGLQRWCNVYELEINDAFIVNKNTLWKLVCFKYVLPNLPVLLLLAILCLISPQPQQQQVAVEDVHTDWILVLTQYVMPVISLIVGVFIFYKCVWFVLWDRVIMSRRCINLSQSTEVYDLWRWMIMVSSSMSFAFMSSPWKSCYALPLIWIFWSWMFLLMVYAYLQTKCHETFTTMTLQMYLFNYVQHSRQWIIQPLLFLVLGQIVELLPLFCEHPHNQ